MSISAHHSNTFVEEIFLLVTAKYISRILLTM